MKTDDLISSMAADLPTRPVSPSKAVGAALAISVPIAFGLLLYALHVRPDFWASLGQPRFLFKLAFLFGLSIASLWAVSLLARPGANRRSALAAVAAVLGLMAVAIVLELIMLPSGGWLTSLIGNMATQCLVLVPMMSIVPFVALMTAMRAGAPDSPALAGAAVGLLAGAIGAFFYASYCPNDSPLYIATWYLLAIAAVTVVGSLTGARILRW
jgi:hypothetical protein